MLNLINLLIIDIEAVWYHSCVELHGRSTLVLNNQLLLALLLKLLHLLLRLLQLDFDPDQLLLDLRVVGSLVTNGRFLRKLDLTDLVLPLLYLTLHVVLGFLQACNLVPETSGLLKQCLTVEVTLLHLIVDLGAVRFFLSSGLE